MNSPPGEASATGVLVLVAQSVAWHSTQSAAQLSPRILPEALMPADPLSGRFSLSCGRYTGAALLDGQSTAWSTEKSALKNWPTILPDGLMSYTSLERPSG